MRGAPGVGIEAGVAYRNDRDTDIQRCQFQIILLAETLSRSVSDAECCMKSNSRWTGGESEQSKSCWLGQLINLLRSRRSVGPALELVRADIRDWAAASEAVRRQVKGFGTDLEPLSFGYAKLPGCLHPRSNTSDRRQSHSPHCLMARLTKDGRTKHLG